MLIDACTHACKEQTCAACVTVMTQHVSIFEGSPISVPTEEDNAKLHQMLCTILPCSSHIGVMRGHAWGHVGVMLESCWGHA